MKDDKQKGSSYGDRPRKYLEADYTRFVETPKGAPFRPTLIADEDEIIAPHHLIFGKRPIEVVDNSDKDSDAETSWEARVRKIEEEFSSRYTQFHEHPQFKETFRKLLAECSDETLVELLRCSEFHALKHEIPACEECGDDDSGIELEHQLRSLGSIWLATVNSLALVPQELSGSNGT
jgi:hypothetical protein